MKPALNLWSVARFAPALSGFATTSCGVLVAAAARTNQGLIEAMNAVSRCIAPYFAYVMAGASERSGLLLFELTNGR